MQEESLTDNKNPVYTAKNSASPESTQPGATPESADASAEVKRAPLSHRLHALVAALASEGRDYAQKCGESEPESVAGVCVKGAIGTSTPTSLLTSTPLKRLTKQGRHRQLRNHDRQQLEKKRRSELFTLQNGKIIARETGTLFVVADLDFDPKRPDLEKRNMRSQPIDETELARELVRNISTELEIEGESHLLQGVVRSLGGR